MNAAAFFLENNAQDTDCAVVTKDESYSYGQLKSTVQTLSNHLSKTVGSGQKILLFAPNSYFFIVSYLAIMNSNNTVVLLDTRSESETIQKVCQECDINLILSDKSIDNIQASFITPKMLPEMQSTSYETPQTDPQDIAVIIYTSGSTGEKKGVMITHQNLITNTSDIKEYLNLTNKDRIAVVLPFYYCYGASLLHTHLKAGASVFLHRGIFVGAVLDEIEQFKCTGIAGVPSTFQILMSKTDFLQRELPSLRYFTQAGGKLANAYIEKIRDTFKNKELFIMYGATEATSRLSYLQPNLLHTKLGSIGKGLANTELRVVDDQGNDIQPGQTGEIIAQGNNIMKGYFKDEAMTNQVLKDSWYHTGDLATIDEEGFVYIVGRSKLMIKVAGNRISPLEIEDVISQVDDVDDSCVFGVEDDLASEAICAVIATQNASDELKQRIQRHCADNLASYKLPKTIKFAQSFPINSSSKKDRMKIKEMFQ